MSAIGIVKLMSVVPSVDVFCTIMSTLTLASASGSKSAADTPGLVGHTEHGDLGLGHVGDDTGDDRIFH